MLLFVTIIISWYGRFSDYLVLLSMAITVSWCERLPGVVVYGYHCQLV